VQQHTQKPSGKFGGLLPSPEINQLRDYFAAKRFSFATDILLRPNHPEIVVSIPESSLAETASKERTSHHQLAIIRAQIFRQLGLKIEFVFIRDALQQKIEAGLNALIQSRYSGQLGAAFLSAQPNAAYDVWLEQTAEGVGDYQLPEGFMEAAAGYFSLVGAKFGTVRVIGAQTKAPSFSVILRSAKRLAPVGVDKLYNLLEGLGFVVPTPGWLESKLDTLRRRNLLVRLKNGLYVLSESGLVAVPITKTRNSSDIERALALGRVKW
jgi:hypothetical protein